MVPLSWCFYQCLKQQGVAKPKGPLEALRPKLQVINLEPRFSCFLCGLCPILRSCPAFAANAATDALQEVSNDSI